MSRWKIAGLTMSALLVSAAALAAQPGPGAGMQMRGGAPGGNSASFFLAHTGDLRLSDAQVTRLAAIARRTDSRREALRASMDSAGMRRQASGARPDSATRARTMQLMRTTMEREREASRVDLRDALAVLTPDQLASAWEMRGASRQGARQPRMRQMRQQRSPAQGMRRPNQE